MSTLLLTWTLSLSFMPLLACASPPLDASDGLDRSGEGSTLQGDQAPLVDTAGEEPPEEPPEEEPPEEEPPEGRWVCGEEIRNGSEICDDAAFGVPEPYQPMAILCVVATGGVGYVSTNTGPTMDDGVPRCQGWEENGMNAWDHLDYVAVVQCDTDGQVKEVDLGAWAGRGMWTGVHDHPQGGGHMTHTCIAHWEE